MWYLFLLVTKCWLEKSNNNNYKINYTIFIGANSKVIFEFTWFWKPIRLHSEHAYTLYIPILWYLNTNIHIPWYMILIQCATHASWLYKNIYNHGICKQFTNYTCSDISGNKTLIKHTTVIQLIEWAGKNLYFENFVFLLFRTWKSIATCNTVLKL